MAGKITSNELSSTLNTQINKVNTLATIATTGSAINAQFSNPNFTSTNVGTALEELSNFVNIGKNAIATNITNKGVAASGNDTFSTLATKISQIQTGIQLVDNLPATGTEGQIALVNNRSMTSGLLVSTGLVTGGYHNRHSVCYGSDRFVCTGYSASAAGYESYYSIDGETWTTMTGLTTNRHYYSVCYGNNRFITVGDNGASFYSTNGTSWTAMTGLNTGYNYRGVIYGNNKFVCVGFNDVNIEGGVYYSTNGTSWNIVSGLNISCYAICYGYDRFMCVGDNGVSYYSLDGISWVSIPGLATGAAYTSICYSNGNFICTTDTGQSYYYNRAANQWIISTKLGATLTVTSQVRYFNNIFIYLGNVGLTVPIIKYSNDGINWNDLSSFDTSFQYNDVAAGGSKVVFVGTGGHYCYRKCKPYIYSNGQWQ